MTLNATTLSEHPDSSLDIVEQTLAAAELSYERDTEDSVHCIAPTRWGELGCLFAQRWDPAAIHFTMTLDVKPARGRRAELCDLVARINERLWLGHFDYWAEENLIMFRHALPMLERREPEPGEITAVLLAATEAVDRFVPSMNFVIWAGKSAQEAVDTALFETIGEA